VSVEKPVKQIEFKKEENITGIAKPKEFKEEIQTINSGLSGQISSSSNVYLGIASLVIMLIGLTIYAIKRKNDKRANINDPSVGNINIGAGNSNAEYN